MESFRAENEAITKYHFNKKQIAVALPLFCSLFISCLFSPFSLKVKRIMCHYESTPSLATLVLILCEQREGWPLGPFDWSIDLLVGIKGFCFVPFCLEPESDDD